MAGRVFGRISEATRDGEKSGLKYESNKGIHVSGGISTQSKGIRKCCSETPKQYRLAPHKRQADVLVENVTSGLGPQDHKQTKSWYKIDTGKAVDADLVVTESSGIESEVQDDSSRSRNDTDADDAEFRPIYDEEPMAEVGLTSILDNVKATWSNFECEAHCIALELKYQNHALKSGQHGQILNETSNKAKIKCDIDEIETINIKLEHSVAKLLTHNEHLNKENETLKKHYKDLYDSIKITRSKTIEQTTALLANNVDLKAQIQEKVFAIAALKNDLRKLKGNSIDTKFGKTSVLGKLVVQSPRNQSVVRQPNAFKSERPQMSKQRFASQVDVNNNLSKPVTQHYLPKKRESVFEKPDHMIASSKSRNSSKNMPRFSSNDMVHNHYLDEAKKKTQERDRNSKTSMTPSARFQSNADDNKPKPRRQRYFDLFSGVLILKIQFAPLLLEEFGFCCPRQHHKSFHLSEVGRENGISKWSLKEEVYVASQNGSLIQDHPESLPSKETYGMD
ncbi:hypothetical protein Tco_0318073 [Tanacetum coccineum]